LNQQARLGIAVCPTRPKQSVELCICCCIITSELTIPQSHGHQALLDLRQIPFHERIGVTFTPYYPAFLDILLPGFKTKSPVLPGGWLKSDSIGFLYFIVCRIWIVCIYGICFPRSTRVVIGV